MRLRMKSSDDQACSYALFELNASLIKYAVKRWLNELSNHRFNHEESQDDDQDDDENETAEAV